MRAEAHTTPPDDVAIEEVSALADTPRFIPSEDPPRRAYHRFVPDRALALHILTLAMPVVVGMLTQTAINVLDTVMVGYLPKEQANPGQAAIGAALPLMWLVGGFLSSVWVGTQALTSRRAGAGRDLEAGKILINSVFLAVAGSIVISTAAIIATPIIFRTLFSDAAVISIGSNYLSIRYLGIVAMVTTFSYKSFFDGIGQTRVFMVAALSMNFFNVLLNYILIFGAPNFGVPRLGVAGAAWASVISAYLGLALLVVASLLPAFRVRYAVYHLRNFSGAIQRQIINLSLPNGAAAIAMMIGFVAYYWVVSQVNAQHAVAGNPVIAAANQVVVTIAMLGVMGSMAFGTATAAIVGQSLGAARIKLAEYYAWDAAKLWVGILALFGVSLLAFPATIAGWVSQDPQVVTAAVPAMRLLAVTMPAIAIGIVFAQTLYGIGQARFVMKVELVLHFCVMSPLAYLFGYHLELGLVGLFLGPAIYILLLSVAVTLKVLGGSWKHTEI